jgi:hypothetical protein
MALYKIQRQLYGIDNWEDENDSQTYTSFKEAKKEITEFINDCMHAFHMGYMSDYPKYSEFRIKKIG